MIRGTNVELFNFYNQESLKVINLSIFNVISLDFCTIRLYKRDFDLVYDVIQVGESNVYKLMKGVSVFRWFQMS